MNLSPGRGTATGQGAGPSIELALARARADAGLPVDVASVASDEHDRRVLDLALALGAPLAPVIDRLVDAAHARARLVAEVRRASAEGRAVATGLVVGPPVLGLATAALVADDPVAVLRSPAGTVLLGVTALLWLGGLALVVVALRRATAPVDADDELFLLTATALRAGEPLSAALRRAAAAVGVPPADPAGRSGRSRGPPPPRGSVMADPAALALWLDLGAAGAAPAGWGVVGGVLASAQATGVALAPLLDRLAADRRLVAHDAALERAARLGATLAVPTALFLLPAGLLLAAGPLLLAAVDQLT